MVGSEVALLSAGLFFQIGDEVVPASTLMPSRFVILKEAGESVTSLIVPPKTKETSGIRDVLELCSFTVQVETLASTVEVLISFSWGVGDGVLTVCGIKSRVVASGIDTCPGSAAAVVGSWGELFSASLLARSGFPDKVTLGLLTIVAGVILLVMSPMEVAGCEVVVLIMFSKGNLGGFLTP